jgi:hypothetical protein
MSSEECEDGQRVKPAKVGTLAGHPAAEPVAYARGGVSLVSVRGTNVCRVVSWRTSFGETDSCPGITSGLPVIQGQSAITKLLAPVVPAGASLA